LTPDALARGYDVESQAMLTAPGRQNGQTSAAISESVNHELAQHGAILESTESLARALRARF
jgi:hypothetical protein